MIRQREVYYSLIVWINNMKGEHYHEWQYGEPIEIDLGAGSIYKVIRFCTSCLKVEKIDLNLKD